VPVNGTATVQCLSAATAPTAPSVVDVCGNPIMPVLDSTVDNPAPLTCEGTRTFNYSYTDCSGLVSLWSYTYTIENLDFTMPADQGSTIACAALLAAPSVPTVTDNCGNALTPVGPVVSTTPACEGDVTYTYTFTDCEGNTHDWVYTYTIESLDFTMPADQASTIACAAQLAAPTAPTVTDNCGNALTPVGPVVSATPACDGNVTYTYTYTDCEGNSHDWVYTYTILDNIAPVITTPTNSLDANLVCENTGGIAAALAAAPTATDNCAGAVTIHLVSDVTTPLTSSCTNTYTRVRTWNFTDCANNTSTNFVQTINVYDTTAPVISTPAADLTVACDGSGNTAQLAAWLTTNGGAMATDNCSGITWTNNFSGLTQGVCAGSQYATVTFTATDDCGNASTTTANFEMQDLTAPVLTGIIPANVSNINDCIANAPVGPTAAEFAALFTDVCSGIIVDKDAVILGYAGV
jgi:hypothetical protein